MDKNGWLMHVLVNGLTLEDCVGASYREPPDVADFVWALLYQKQKAMTTHEEALFRAHVEAIFGIPDVTGLDEVSSGA